MELFSETDDLVRKFCIKALEELITNFKDYKLSNQQLRLIIESIEILGSYPEQSINGHIEISASTEWTNGSRDYAIMIIEGNHFELLTGGSVYTEGIGSDLFSKTIYNSEVGEESTEGSIGEWLESFNMHKYSLKVIDETDKETDLFENIVSDVADKIVNKIVRKTISALQKDKTKLSGDDSGLENVWDEICAQVQTQESIFWKQYEDLVYNYVDDLVEKLSQCEKCAVWLQTEQGMDWYYGKGKKESGCTSSDRPYYQNDVVEFINYKVFYTEAANWSNKRIREYVEKEL